MCGRWQRRRGRNGLEPTGDKQREAIANDRRDSGPFLELWDEFQRKKAEANPWGHPRPFGFRCP